MDKEQRKDRNEPVSDEELEHVSGGTVGDVQDMRHDPRPRSPLTPSTGSLDDLTGGGGIS